MNDDDVINVCNCLNDIDNDIIKDIQKFWKVLIYFLIYLIFIDEYLVDINVNKYKQM